MHLVSPCLFREWLTMVIRLVLHVSCAIVFLLCVGVIGRSVNEGRGINGCDVFWCSGAMYTYSFRIQVRLEHHPTTDRPLGGIFQPTLRPPKFCTVCQVAQFEPMCADGLVAGLLLWRVSWEVSWIGLTEAVMVRVGLFRCHRLPWGLCQGLGLQRSPVGLWSNGCFVEPMIRCLAGGIG